MKTCTKCHETLSLDEFNRDARRPDGRRPWCRACQNEARRRRRAEDPEYRARVNEAQRLRMEDPEYRARERAADLRWRAEHPEAARERRRRRRARKRDALSTLTREEWEDLLDLHDYRCYVCEAPWEHLEHLVPLVTGGGHTASNVRPACADCNLSKGARPLADWLPERLAYLAEVGA